MTSSRNSPANPLIPVWMDAVMIILTGISSISILLVSVGSILLDSDSLFLIGVAIMTAGAAGWSVLAALLICRIVRLWFNGSGKARKASQPATLE